MKKPEYEAVKIETIKFETEDVVTTSADEDVCVPFENPEHPGTYYEF